MCYNPEISITTLACVALVSMVLWKREKPFLRGLALFLFFIALMQGVEALLWYHTACTPTNQQLSRIIPLLLYSQPIVLLVTTLVFQMGRLPSVVYVGLLLFWFLCAPLWIEWAKEGNGQCTTLTPQGHLAWPYANRTPIPIVQTLYHLLMTLVILSWNTPWYGVFYVTLSALSYVYVKRMYGHSWGSLWCHLVNVLALAALWIQ